MRMNTMRVDEKQFEKMSTGDVDKADDDWWGGVDEDDGQDPRELLSRINEAWPLALWRSPEAILMCIHDVGSQQEIGQ